MKIYSGRKINLEIQPDWSCMSPQKEGVLFWSHDQGEVTKWWLCCIIPSATKVAVCKHFQLVQVPGLGDEKKRGMNPSTMAMILTKIHRKTNVH